MALGPAPTLNIGVAQPLKEAPPATAGTPQLLPPGVGTGRPGGFKPDAVPAFWIWQGPRGHWRLRTTSKDQLHVCRGRIYGVRGRVQSIEPSRTEFRDRIWTQDGGWAFSFRTKSHADGFTFEVAGNGCVRFDLELTGGAEAKRVFIGSRQYQPTSNHFTVCPKNAPGLRR